MFRAWRAVCLAILIAVGGRSAPGDTRRPLAYAPAPVDNPLKGLVPYQFAARAPFPHSMEFSYLPYSALVRGEDEFDWQPLEKVLDEAASRGHQVVFRVFLEYPGKNGVIPDFLLQQGLKVTTWKRADAPPLPPSPVETPDYEDGNLRRSLRTFVAALGKKYDGDPRVGFITAGLLGIWGEWHDSPKHELFASKAVQREVMDAYAAAFKVTPVLLRYPSGENGDRRFGYHDDSFAWSTLPTGKEGSQWFYMSALLAAGPAAEAKWKTCPIGGEIRPEAWGRVFDADPGRKEIQDFHTCVEATHVTWLMDSGMFAPKQEADRSRRAEEQVRRMGYEFHVPAVTVGEVREGKLAVALEIENRGVAPFYYDWKAEWGLLADGKVVQTFPASGKLTGLLPGDTPRTWADALELSGVKAGQYTLAVHVPNPLPSAKPLRFANETQDATAPGWLTLGDIQVR